MTYTVQQIIAALELYDKLKKVAPTVRQLGYPSRGHLHEWINQREYTGGKFPDIEPSGIKKINNYVRINHEGFSAEKKLEILRRCFEGTENIRDVAIDECVSRAMIYQWRRKYLRDGVFGFQQKKKNIKRSSSLEELREVPWKEENSPQKSSDSEEIATIKKQLKEMQMKVDVMTEVFEILKKRPRR